MSNYLKICVACTNNAINNLIKSLFSRNTFSALGFTFDAEMAPTYIVPIASKPFAIDLTGNSAIKSNNDQDKAQYNSCPVGCVALTELVDLIWKKKKMKSIQNLMIGRYYYYPPLPLAGSILTTEILITCIIEKLHLLYNYHAPFRMGRAKWQAQSYGGLIKSLVQ